MPRTAKESILEHCRDLHERAAAYWRPRHEAMTQLDRFEMGDRYEDNGPTYNRDGSEARIRGQELFDTIRHIAAKATERPRSVEARPIDKIDDADLAEVAVSIMDWELSNPYLGFDTLLEGAIIDARRMRLGVVWFEWDKENEMRDYFRIDPRDIMWDPQYDDPHHPKCGWVCIERRVHPEDAREQWKKRGKDLSWIQPDSAYRSGYSDSQRRPISQRGGVSNFPQQMDDKKATCRYWYFKNDSTYEESGETEEPLDPKDHYMTCVSCGEFKSDTQGEMQDAGELEGDLPPVAEGACPHCFGDMHKVEAKAVDYVRMKYEKGKRLVVEFPYCNNPDNEPVYDGAWPWPKPLRSFPGLFITAYHKPGEPVGPCDVDLMWDQQQASDELRTAAVQQVMHHRGFWLMDRNGFYDTRGNRFTFKRDQRNVILRDKSNPNMPPPQLEHINTSGVDPNFMVAFNICQTALTQYRGMSDQGPIEERAKAKSGVALQTENAIGEVPVAHFIRRVHQSLSKSDAFKGLMEAFGQAVQLGLPPDKVVELWGDLNNVPRSVLRGFSKMLEEQKAEMEQQQMAQMGAMQPGMGAPPPDDQAVLAALSQEGMDGQ